MTKAVPTHVLRIRNFRMLWIGEGISLLGDQFYMIALPWLVLTLTGNALAVGTVFDTAAALAGIRQRVNYEGQAAIEFEALADQAEAEAYPFALEQDQVEVRTAFQTLVKDVQAGISLPKIGAIFHNGLAEIICATVNQISKDTGIRAVTLSGGVWQNITLMRRTLSLLRADGFQVYLYHQVPTNDGGLSLGQVVIAASRLRGGYDVSRIAGENKSA